MNGSHLHQLNATSREVEREIEIDAPVDAVWRALTDARELERWFPLEAEMTPGSGGFFRMKWGDAYEIRSDISIWEPERHLRFDFPAVHGEHLATDYYLEGRGGKTVLRVVSSGFGVNSDWDESYEGVSRGWDFELLGLRHYLEHHAGRDRSVILAVQPYSCAHDRAWALLTGPGGWLGDQGLSCDAPGERYLARTSSGEELSGEVLVWQPPRQFGGTVEGFNNALLRIGLESGHGGSGEVWLMMSTYGLASRDVNTLGSTWKGSLARLFQSI